jgi:S1-C subfamily serine protease
MKRFFCLAPLMVLVFLTHCCHGGIHRAVDKGKTYDFFKSVVRIRFFFEDGKENPTIVASGFSVTKDIIITARHFCMSLQNHELGKFKNLELSYINDKNKVVTVSGRKFGEMAFIFYEDDADLCAIRLINHNVMPIEIVKNDSSLQVFSEVMVAGAPLGYFPVVTRGEIVEYQRSIKEENGRLTLNVPGTFGNSGGPVVNSKGKVIGVVMGKSMLFEHIMFAITFEDLNRFLDKVKNG